MVESYGIHRVQCGDIRAGVTELMGADKASIMYSDPPWGGGNIKFWATKLKKDTGQEIIPATFAELLGTFFGIARDYCDGFLLVEYGKRWSADLQNYATSHGFTPRGIFTETYSGGVLDMHLFLAPAAVAQGLDYPDGLPAQLEGLSGYTAVISAVRPLAEIVRAHGLPQVILDPCCGMGFTAQAAVDTGFAFRGNELNPVRLAKTIRRLS